MSDDDLLIKQALAMLAREETLALPPFTRCLRQRRAPRRWQWRIGMAVAAAPVVVGLMFLLRPVTQPKPTQFERTSITLPLESLIVSLDPELMSGTPDFESALLLAREFAKKEVPP